MTSSSQGTPAAPPFQFCTSLALQESLGLRAVTLTDLAKLLHTVPESCIYHHTHHFLFQHHYLTPEPTNDFAYWVTEILGEQSLGERLEGIDILQYATLQELREAFISTIEGYLAQYPSARLRFASEGEEFFFIKSVHVVMATPHTASSLEEFARGLEEVSIRSLYFHIFDARLRLGRPTNDFALWVEQLGYRDLAKELSHLDPYAHTLETIRSMIISMVRKEMAGAVD